VTLPLLDLPVAGHPGDDRDDRAVQAAIPAFRSLVRLAGQAATDAFAHPFERDFARILTYYRVRWAYEPTAFALAWDANGDPTELFTPDFYLPDHRLYVELTAMRQRLVTRKHRKVRRLRELYPNVQIKLLYRRDYQRLATAYAAARPDPGRLAGRVLFDEETIRRRIAELAEAVAEDCRALDGAAPAPLLLLTVGGKPSRFLVALSGALRTRGVGVEVDRVVVSRFRTGPGRCRVRIRRTPKAPLAGRRVLVVDDVVSTGLSLAYLLRWLGRKGARPEVCTLLDRPAARVVDVPIRYRGFEAPNEVLVGFGLR
jgi:hypoxanthine phosphoribosyltransferase